MQLRRAGLRIPQAELVEFAPRHLFEAADEIFDSRGLSVVAREIQIHAFAEHLRADNRLQHADDFGALLVNRRSVEIVDGDIGLRLYRMGEGTRVFLELAKTQILYVRNPPHRM